jgi:hypothetical protein
MSYNFGKIKNNAIKNNEKVIDFYFIFLIFLVKDIFI